MMQHESSTNNIRSYCTDYVYRALNDDRLEEPAPTGDNLYDEALMCLYNTYRTGDKAATKAAWEKLVEIQPQLRELTHHPKKIRRLLHASELATLPPIQWLLEGMIPMGTLCELHGAPGAGKSFLALHLAATIACHKPVLYVAAEGALGYRGRLAAWETHYKQKPKHLYFYSEAVNLFDINAVRMFIEEVRHIKPVLIIFDTLARCMIGADENSSGHMGLVITNCDALRAELDTTVMLVHHTAKSGNVERGSGALRGGSDSMIELVNHDGLIKVSSSKLKDGKPFDDLYYKMVELESSVVLVTSDRVVTALNQKLSKNERSVLEMLEAEIYRTIGAPYSRIKDNTGISPSTLDRSLGSLKSRGYILQSQKGEPYTITDEGRKAIAP